MLSTPVCGVEVRKDAAAPLLAPLSRRLAVTGMTPQEQSGMGTPTSEARTMDFRPGLPSLDSIQASLIHRCSAPATRNPRSR